MTASFCDLLNNRPQSKLFLLEPLPESEIRTNSRNQLAYPAPMKSHCILSHREVVQAEWTHHIIA